MKKIINAPESFVPEMLEGIYAAHPGELTYVNEDLHCGYSAPMWESMSPFWKWPGRPSLC